MRGIKAVRLALLASLSLVCMAGALSTTAAEAAEGPTNSSPPMLSGMARDGQRLKVSKGAWSGLKPITYAYKWSRCAASGGSCAAIPSAGRGFYKLTHADVGHTVQAIVTASNPEGETNASAPQSDVVASAPLSKRKHPTISGSPLDGQMLTVGNGTWKGTPPQSYAYQWQSCPKGGTCTDIPGATGASYRATTAQIGQKLRAVVTAANAVGQANAPSKASKAIAAGPPVNTGTPTISGSLQEGQTLNATAGKWAGTAPISFAYQWLRCSVAGGSCEPIAGATDTSYTLAAGDLASNIAVVVTAANAKGSTEATSAETQAVLGILPTNTVLPSISGLLQDGGLLSARHGQLDGLRTDLLRLPVGSLQRARHGVRRTQRRDRLDAETGFQRDRQDAGARRHSHQRRRLHLGHQLGHRSDRRHPAEKHRAASDHRGAETGPAAQRQQRHLDGQRTDHLQLSVAAVPAGHVHGHRQRDEPDLPAERVEPGQHAARRRDGEKRCRLGPGQLGDHRSVGAVSATAHASWAERKAARRALYGSPVAGIV